MIHIQTYTLDEPSREDYADDSEADCPETKTVIVYEKSASSGVIVVGVIFFVLLLCVGYYAPRWYKDKYRGNDSNVQKVKWVPQQRTVYIDVNEDERMY